ncbi:unnamed protein product [Cyprideis torosa]|uniref:Uncharacterized protein n=1 Tax=Cyprideis torosa TaxID=163714 RepID=A0A7R8WLX7_9CRUS|nr:unnamed protein product [Cyprideis torosa]CAG0897790.1 unnamed protein product [Cyprideis torosa]
MRSRGISLRSPALLLFVSSTSGGRQGSLRNRLQLQQSQVFSVILAHPDSCGEVIVALPPFAMESMDQWRGIALASQEMSATAECLPLAIGNALPRTRQLNISVVGGLFEFETNPCIFGGQRFFSKYWPICFPITLLYLFMIYTGQRFMKNRGEASLLAPFRVDEAMAGPSWAQSPPIKS